MRELEDSLGVRLFERKTRALELTTAGHTLLDEVEPLLEALDRSLALIARRSGRQTLRLLLPPFFASELLIPRLTNPLLDELVSAHVRSLMPSHLIDVVSTDKHTVKPWFAGHADVSPVVADFEPRGYRLIGGRVDYLDHQRSAVVVYQHGAHVINVFSWAGHDRALPADTTRSGYHFAFWRTGDLTYCAVSDTGWDELLGLVKLLRE